MKDLIIALILIIIVGCAVLYIYKAKKSGSKCIGCPDAGSCGKNKDCGCQNTK